MRPTLPQALDGSCPRFEEAITPVSFSRTACMPPAPASATRSVAPCCDHILQGAALLGGGWRGCRSRRCGERLRKQFGQARIVLRQHVAAVDVIVLIVVGAVAVEPTLHALGPVFFVVRG